MIWLVAHFDHDGEDWAIDFVGTEDRAREALHDMHGRKPDRLYHLFCEVEAISSRFDEGASWQTIVGGRNG